MILKFYRSTIGKKVVVALTGIVLLLFVLGHMLGNLKAFAGYNSAGVHKLDHYAEFLRVMGSNLVGHAGVLWMLRIGLIVCVVLHVVTILQLEALKAKSRPVGYQKTKSHSATIASKSMFWGGIILLFFIVYHLLHLTFGAVTAPGFVAGQVYANVFYAFKLWYVTLIYVVAMGALGLHVYHGAWSVFQTLGLDNPAWNKTLLLAARLFAIVIVVGFCALPLSIFFDVLPPPRV